MSLAVAMASRKVMWICDPEAEISAKQHHPGDWDVRFLEPDRGLSQLASEDYAALVVDCPVPGWTAAALLAEIQRSEAVTPVLVRDPEATLADAVQLARLGIHQFLMPGDDPFSAIEAAIGERREPSGEHTDQLPWESFLVGKSREMLRISQIIRLVGERRATVLITGETGTGKELAARAIHLAGKRGAGPMVAINCSALPESLLESELFGTVRGAYTGAWQSRAGRFEQAQGGTIFLDEIGELSPELQAKLLRVLQEREVQRLGGLETIKLDVRVIAATNCDLLERVAQGDFREDLYYRLNVVPLRMPPLRERAGDVPILAHHFVKKICRAEGLPVKQLSADAELQLTEYSWPGNVRQLENSIESAIALSGDRSVLGSADFPGLTPPRPRAISGSAPLVSVPHGGLDYERTLAGIEKSILDQALRMTGGNKKAAAELLRLKRTTLSAKVRSLAYG